MRRNGLSESNATEYLKYAIGEVVLVVIGILIAFQLNNFNENRKNKTFEREILTQMQENLKSDGQALAEIERNFNRAIRSANQILQTKPSQNIEDSIHIWLGTIIQFDRFQPLTNAYEVLKSNGLDKISNKQLRFLLGRYYDDEALRIIKSTSDIEMAFNDHWVPILFEETEEFEFKKSVKLKNHRILLKPSKERNILKLSRDNYASGMGKIQRGLKRVEEIQGLLAKEIIQ
ncbi:MAG: DUF6090 family protein [Bacteroidota bacterium]